MEYPDWLFCDGYIELDCTREVILCFSEQPEISPMLARFLVFVMVIPISMDAMSTAFTTGRLNRRPRSKVLPLVTAC